MRNTWDSSNTLPIASVIASADCREWPIGFSSTMRVSAPARPAMARLAAMGANSCGAVAR
ncbi:hypothetical protein D3C86_1781640 [compost metagenome]